MKWQRTQQTLKLIEKLLHWNSFLHVVVEILSVSQGDNTTKDNVILNELKKEIRKLEKEEMIRKKRYNQRKNKS